MSRDSGKVASRLTEGVDEASLAADDFSAAECVNGFLKETRPGDELRKLRALRAQLNVASSSAFEQIKDIVFDHYKQFIDTSKQVSSLEREIYELSALLTDQKTMLESMMEACGRDKRSSCSTSLHSAGASAPQSPVQSLIHRVEGIADVLNNLKPTEKLLLVSEMSLLNENTMEIVEPILVVLLSETFLIAKPNDAGGRLRFAHASAHRLDKVAIVNVKRAPTERPYAELIIQLICFPQNLYLKCESARAKRQWLDGIESAKRSVEQEKSLQRQATIRAKRKKSSTTPHPADPRARLQRHAGASPSASVIYEDEALERGGDASGASSTAAADDDEEAASGASEEALWLKDLAAELQDVLAQHHVDEATDMLLEWKECTCTNAKLNAEFAELERTLVRMLSDDVRRPGALHGGARALAQPLHLLKRLGRGTYATNLYLRRRSTALSAKARELTISEDPLAYVRHVSALFVGEIFDVLREFDAQNAESCLVQQWSSGEVSLLVSLIRRHVVEVAPTMAVLARTWSILLDECERLADAGMDLSFEVHRLLAPALRSALDANFANILESVRLRIRDESWQPYVLGSEASLNRYLEEMADFGFQLDYAIASQPPHSLDLAQSGCHFSRAAFTLSRDLNLLKSTGLRNDDLYVAIWRTFCRFLADAPVSRIHSLTCEFVVNEVVALCERVYCDDDADEGLLTTLIRAEFPRLTRYARRRTPPLTRQAAAADGDEDEEVANV